MRVNLSNIDHVKHNGVECDRVVFNGVEVWRKYATVTGKIVQLDNENTASRNAIVEIKGDYPEGTTFELTRCGRNFLNLPTELSGNYLGGTIEVSANQIQADIPSATREFLYGPALPMRVPQSQYKLSYDVTRSNLVDPESYKLEFKSVISTLFAASTPVWVDDTEEEFTLDESTKYVQLVPQSFVVGQSYQTTVYDMMLELGTTAHDYEPYNGNTITIAPNTPTTISMLDGINTFFADSDVNVTVKYPSTNVTPLVAQETADLMALGVTPAETVAQQQQQLNEMGVN